MSEHREAVTMRFNDNFTGRMRLAAGAATRLHRELAIMGATWEPHDWRDFA